MDDIQLPPLPKVGPIVTGVAQACEVLQDYARAAVLADRERRKPERLVHRGLVDISMAGLLLIGAGPEQPLGWKRIELCWTDDGRAWIDSEKNRELAKQLRHGYMPYSERVGAADALDGGV